LRSEPLARYESFIARRVYHVSEREYCGGFECPAGGTNNMSYRRSVLEEVNGFDEFFRYAAGEDADLKWRLCARGHTLLFVPIKMTHLHEYSWARFRRQCFFRGKGRTQYEIRRGRKPNAAILFARVAAALVRFPRDLFTVPEKSFAVLRCMEQVLGAAGQWSELRRHENT